MVYCAELFENNGSLLATLIKVMTGDVDEYSRELDRENRPGHIGAMQSWGSTQGGPPNYGLRRVLVDASTPTGRCRSSMAKQRAYMAIGSSLSKGPGNETETVREIFRLFIAERMPHRQIARHLNKKGLRNRRGNPWSNSNIINMLRNENMRALSYIAEHLGHCWAVAH